jgi:hypothetical protein
MSAVHAVTGACAEVFVLTLPEDVELDHETPVAREEIVSAFRERMTPLSDEEIADDIDVGDNVF